MAIDILTFEVNSRRSVVCDFLRSSPGNKLTLVMLIQMLKFAELQRSNIFLPIYEVH